MEVLATLILRFKKTILVGMLLGTAICLVLMQMVTINESHLSLPGQLGRMSQFLSRSQ